MAKLVKLDKDLAINPNFEYVEYNTPELIYVPLPPKKEELKKVAHIKKDSPFYQDVYAPVSGKLVGIDTCLLPSRKKKNCMVIQNDYQEKSASTKPTRRKITGLKKEEFLNSILNQRLRKKIADYQGNTILISGIDDEPYIANESFLQQKKTKYLVDTLEALLGLYPNSKAIIALKNTDSKTILAYQNILGMYKNMEIKFVDDLYLIGKEPFLKRYLRIHEEVLYLKASEVYELYVNVKKNRPLVEKYLTISGSGITKPRLIKTKLGVNVAAIFNKYYVEDLSNCAFYVNGLMGGIQLDLNQVIVTKDLQGIMVMKKEHRTQKSCIKCGKCISICPFHKNPLMAYKLGLKVKCMQCGLCSYICPSYIPLQKYLEGENDE